MTEKQSNKERVCAQCTETKKPTQFYYTKRDGYSKICRSCTQKNKYKVQKMDVSAVERAKKTPANIDGICKKVLGKYVKNAELSGNEMLLQLLLEFAMKDASKREKKDIMMFIANKMNPNPKEHKVVEQKLTIEKDVSDAVEELICDLKVIDGGRA